MQFEPDELLRGLEVLARREGLAARLDRDAMMAALDEARTLAAGRPEHEPAALLYAFGRRTACFGPVAQLFLRSLVHAQSLANGCELEMNDVELAIHVARITLGQIDFLELRGWCAARLRPLGQNVKRPPPKRPRWQRACPLARHHRRDPPSASYQEMAPRAPHGRGRRPPRGPRGESARNHTDRRGGEGIPPRSGR